MLRSAVGAYGSVSAGGRETTATSRFCVIMAIHVRITVLTFDAEIKGRHR